MNTRYQMRHFSILRTETDMLAMRAKKGQSFPGAKKATGGKQVDNKKVFVGHKRQSNEYAELL